ncbi:hypothetical protein OZD68_02735 [Wolbachia endosymbiont of Drosophila bicornuta]|uniref:hypothetical protein n=1 Tax=Wolbachia endosymbiont of Drosophila bicornuta TaxID=375918 RepID=UPI0023A9CD46|nr:hypothetical protein [Wolbachia endosymbiont of Drosophila bicornuta]MDE5056505.1 hypothetical protein [Wolbachia endosymbiont of Drosophila bicornuta]
MLLLYHSHKHISYPIRTIARSAIFVPATSPLQASSVDTPLSSVPPASLFSLLPLLVLFLLPRGSHCL